MCPRLTYLLLPASDMRALPNRKEGRLHNVLKHIDGIFYLIALFIVDMKLRKGVVCINIAIKTLFASLQVLVEAGYNKGRIAVPQ